MVTPLRRVLRAGNPEPDSGAPAPTPAPAGQEEIRRHNLGAVLRHVHVHGPTTRAALTSGLGLNRSTIGALAADLAAAGLVTEQAPAASARRAGRPSLVVSPRSGAVYTNALSIEADRLRAARVGLGGRVLDLREAERPRGASVLDSVPLIVELLEGTRPGAGARCVGAAIAVTDTTGVAEALPGYVVGDLADTAALAEHVRGAAAGIDDLVYLHGDGGVSAGIVTGGHLLTGHRGRSGKVGHMVVNPDGRRCPCGSRGCWQTEIGTEALLRRAALDDATGVADVVRAAAAGHERAARALDRVGDWLGFGVANLVNVFNPDALVFGGTLAELYPAAAATVRRRISTMALAASREHLRLHPSSLGADAAVLGAAELALGPLLSDPLVTVAG